MDQVHAVTNYTLKKNKNKKRHKGKNLLVDSLT